MVKNDELIKKSKEQKKYVWQQILLYMCTVFGVLMSPFVPHLVSIILYSQIPNIDWWDTWHPVRIASVLFVAILMTFLLEKDGDKKGKTKNFNKRIIQHIAYGALWSSFLESIIKGASQ